MPFLGENAVAEERAVAWQPRWLLMLLLLYTTVALIVVEPLTDPDIWWHLRTGEWIVRHGAVPWTDPFSSYGADRPWIAYNWLFELILYGVYGLLGYFGPLLYVVIISLAIAVALQDLIMRFEPRFLRAAALTTLGVAGMAWVLSPRSYLISILFFIVELRILFSARDSNRTRILLLLPPLFALWANLHIQFIYGILAIGLAAVEALLSGLLPDTTAGIRPRAALLRPLVIVGIASCLATLVTPYHIYLHDSILEVVRQTGIYNWNTELMAMDFRQFGNWIVLALTLTAAFVLGRQPTLEIFPALLLAAGAALGFRSRRDVWVVIVAALVIIARASRCATGAKRQWTWPRVGLAGGGVVLIFVGTALVRDVSPRRIEEAIAENYPAEAARVIEARGYNGPLFNTYNWGGYLIWRLPDLPVAMDGRANVHGDDRIGRSIATWHGRQSWASDPELASANLVIAPISIPLTSLLRRDSRFELVYEDPVAAVFVARPEHRHSS